MLVCVTVHLCAAGAPRRCLKNMSLRYSLSSQRGAGAMNASCRLGPSQLTLGSGSAYYCTAWLCFWECILPHATLFIFDLLRSRFLNYLLTSTLATRVSCNGSEPGLASCGRWGGPGSWGNHTCSHWEDAGVTCFNCPGCPTQHRLRLAVNTSGVTATGSSWTEGRCVRVEVRGSGMRA